MSETLVYGGTDPELKPCPKCGGGVACFPSLWVEGYFVIFCPNCCIQTEAYDNADILREAWNRYM